MIKLKEVRSKHSLMERTYICTFCGHEYKFYYLSPERCITCEKTFPDMAALLEHVYLRVEYHFEFERKAVNDT